MRKTLIAVVVASAAVILSASPATAAHGGSDKVYCERSNSTVFGGTYC